MKKVLITGMSGLIGGILRRHLDSVGGYELSALNRSSVEGVEWFKADIADLEAVEKASVGKEVVVHLAVGKGSWEGQLSGTIVGTYNVYEAARRAGVKRVIYASSGMTIRGYTKLEPYKAILEGRYEDVPDDIPKLTHEVIRPQGVYGAAKVWGEALGRHYSDAYGLSVLCVRLGQVRSDDLPHDEHDYSALLSHRDVATMLHKCIEAPESVQYDIFFATSNNKWTYRDLEHPRQVLGWVPQDSAEKMKRSPLPGSVK